MQQPEGGTQGGKTPIVLVVVGGRRKRKIKQRGLVHDLTIQHWNDYCKDSPLFSLSLSSLPKLIK